MQYLDIEYENGNDDLFFNGPLNIEDEEDCELINATVVHFGSDMMNQTNQTSSRPNPTRGDDTFLFILIVVICFFAFVLAIFLCAEFVMRNVEAHFVFWEPEPTPRC